MNKNILVIDDEAFTLRIFKMLLDPDAYDELVLAENGEDSIKFLEEKEFGLVFLDLMLPDMNGMEILKKIKSDDKLKHIRVVIQTGVHDVQIIKDAEKIGISGVLFKPYSKNDLDKIMNKVFVESSSLE